jgi:sugar lactone lactonase YvrE
MISEYSPAGMLVGDLFTSVTSGLPRPRGLRFDSGGNLFAGVAYANGEGGNRGKVLRFTPRAHQSVLGNADHAVFEGVVTDSTGNVYAMIGDEQSPVLAGIIYKFAPDGTRSIFGTTPGQSFDLAFDSSGNLYAADANEATIYKFAPNGTRTAFVGPDAFSSNSAPIGLAFDSSGNLFVSTEGDPGNDSILVFSPDGSSESIFATGLTQPRGMAFDAEGNLFVAETRGAPNGDILKFAPGGGGPTIFASGIARPEFLTFGPPR